LDYCLPLFKNIATGKALYFHPFALLGGVIWNTGNVLTVTIIKCIGMALGLAIWSATSMIVGWLTGKYGLLGTPKDHSVKTDWINYLGVSLILVSLILFFNVTPNQNNDDISASQTDPESHRIVNPVEDMERPIYETTQELHETDEWQNKKIEKDNLKSWIDYLPPKQRGFLGVILALFAGVCYGTCFCPIQYVMKHHKHNDAYSQKLEDYAFTHYCGILLTSIIYFMVYALYMNNKPQVNHLALFPAIVSGFVWSIAQTCFFIATDKKNLGTDTAFPIVSGSPQVIASLWGVLVFREVTKPRDLSILACAILFCVGGVSCIGLSKLSL